MGEPIKGHMTRVDRLRVRGQFVHSVQNKSIQVFGNTLTPTSCMSRLDYFIVMHNKIGWSDRVYKEPGFRSDHSIIGLILEPTEIDRGVGYWKFNNLSIEDKEFVKQITDEVDNCIQENRNQNAQVIWENIKLKIATFSGKYASTKAKARRQKLAELQNELQVLRDEQCFSLIDTTVRQRQIQSEIEQIYEAKTESSYVSG